jgi:hypothetical protein
VERFADQLIGHMGAIEIRGIDMVYPGFDGGLQHRDEKGNWLPAMSPAELTQAVEDNLRHLGLDVLEDNAQIVGVGVERFADQLIGHMGAIEIRGIDMVYPGCRPCRPLN